MYNSQEFSDKKYEDDKVVIILDYTKAVDYIENIPRFSIAEPLLHAKELLSRVGNPQNDLKVIHVAGTNGKGSVCAYLASMMQAGGFRCGLFTSPHLVKMNERFSIDGEMMDDETFVRLFLEVKQVIDAFLEEGLEHPSYFEVVFVMGMLHFKEQQVDVAVVETGLGGKLDATNTVTKPLATVITSISLDHTEYLGDTVEKIAGEKAGIIKKGVPIIYDARNEESACVIAARAREMDAPSYALTDSMYEIKQNTPEGIDFSFQCKYYDTITVSIPYIAPYQMVNASLALLVMGVLRDVHGISDEILCRAVSGTRWEGRMETVLPGVILDGAHNEDGILRFIETARAFRKDYKVLILFSAVADKRYRDMIRMICDEIQPGVVVTTRIPGQRSVPAEALAQVFEQYGCQKVYCVEDVAAAFKQALLLREEGLLFCVGSLYLVGEIKALLRRRIDD